jgi:hypothetical protein
MSKRSILIGILQFLIIALIIPIANAEVSYTFDIDSDGAALYLIEYRTLLDSQEKIDEFDEFKQIVELNSTHKTEFEKRMHDIVNRASIVTSRPMNASDFQLSVGSHETTTGNFGEARYSFKWDGFAQVTGSSITVGDVFFGGQHIFSGDSFIIKIPENYEINDFDPVPDIQRDYELIWIGPCTINPGKPEVVFSEKRISDSYSTWPIAAILLILLFGGVMFLFVKQKSKKAEIEREIDNNFDPIQTAQTSSETAPSELVTSSPINYESDEDWIIALLNENGGSMMQSQIISKTKFSKSKASSLLAKMAEDGLIQRLKKGRENLIRLAKS